MHVRVTKLMNRHGCNVRYSDNCYLRGWQPVFQRGRNEPLNDLLIDGVMMRVKDLTSVIIQDGAQVVHVQGWAEAGKDGCRDCCL